MRRGGGIRRQSLRRAAHLALALGLLLVQLGLPGLQASMLRLDAPSWTEAALAAAAAREGALCAPGDAAKGAIHCAICDQALLPAAPVDCVRLPAATLAGRADRVIAAAEALHEQARAAPFARGPPNLS